MPNNVFNPSLLFTRRVNTSVQLFPHIQSRFITAVSSGLVPNHQQIAHIILEQKSSNQALQTFEWASKIRGFTHDLSTYRALIHVLCAFRQFDTAEQVLDEMPKRIGSSPDDDIFITIVRGLGRAKMTRRVIRVLDLVAKFGEGGRPSLKLLNTILDVLMKEDIDIAREFYRRKMMGCGVKGDEYTYGILMKGFCLTNRIQDGFKLLQVMKSHGVKVSVVVYNTLIHALCKNGKVGRARSLTNEMDEFSGVTYNIFISAYSNENNLVQTLVMFEKCLRDGFLPDVVTLTKLIEILCNAKRASEAVEILERVEKHGGAPDVVAYNTLLKGFVQSGKIKAACGFLKQMEMKGCLPNTDTYNTLIKGFCDSEMLDSALDMFDEMKRDGVHWNYVTFDVLIHGLCSSGKTRVGLKIFETMIECKRKHCVRRVGPYNSILYGLYKEGRVDKVPEFLNYTKVIFPRAATRSLSILQLCEDGNVDEAKQILDKMHEEGDIPCALVYADLIQGLCEKRRMKEGVELMNEMIGRDYVPIRSTYNAVISGFCRHGKVGCGLRVLEELKLRGWLVDFESYGDIVRSLCMKGELQRAVMLVVEMVEMGIAPDVLTWNMLLTRLLVSEGKNEVSNHKLLLLQRLTKT